MKDEIMLARGRHALLVRERRELSLEGKGLVQVIRAKLDPFEPDLAKLNVEEAEVSIHRLKDVQAKIREMDAQIREITEAIGD
ncbi:MAG: hypothetical protein HQK81_06195 [Desulfovibrionaceae bacterium]|nr:hypothetical protein [Desulfovibrionaceae bacterium]MBF0513640.1 hypothetical protein [Desulfovibrionaceae bacterium]